MSGTEGERPGGPSAHAGDAATSVRIATPDGAPSGAPSGASSGDPSGVPATDASGAESGGLNDYLASLSTLGLTPSVDGPRRLSASEVRRHTTGRLRAITDAPDPPRRPTAAGTRAVSDDRAPSRTATARISTIPDASRRPSPRRFVLPTLAVLIAGAIFLPRLFTPAVRAVIPEAMRGEWTTSNPQYATRRLIFTAQEVGIAIGASRSPGMHPVTAVQATGAGDVTRYVITYQQDGEAVPFQLQFTMKPQRRVVLANPPDVLWFPVSEAPVEMPPVAPTPADSAPPPDSVPHA